MALGYRKVRIGDPLIGNVVPLSDPALAVIRRIKKVKSAKQFVFTTTGDTHVTGYNNAAEAHCYPVSIT